MIGDDVRSGLAELRAEAESLMGGHGSIGAPVESLDRATNTLIVTIPAPVYDGRMRVWHGKQSAVAETGGQTVTTNPMMCAIPHHVTGVEPGMVVMLDASDDPELVGRPMVVADVSRHEQAVRRLLTLIDNQG